MIKISGVSKKFISGKSSTSALSDINLEIKKGEFVAIIGPSGSGKSTLLNIIGGLDSPTEGSVFVDKKDLAQMRDTELSHYRNKHIGFIFQEFHLEPFLTVKGNVLLPSFFDTKNSDKEKRATELIHEVQLAGKIDSKITELSGGQKQRTAIARALLNNPTLILADEPTGNLDQKTGDTIIKLLKDLHKKHNVTLIIATHDKEIAKAADKTIKISDGQIVK